jgi:capsular exopolysaccharide synthesis family protein
VAQYELNIRDYWRILRRRKGIVLTVTILFTAFSYTIALFQTPPPLYEASSAIKVERSTNLTGLLMETITLSVGDTAATYAAYTRSWPVLEIAARRLGLIPPEVSSEAARSSPQYLQVVTRLQNQIKAEPEKDTNIIKITAQAADPKTAAKIANSVAEAYREENILSRNRQVREAKQFIESQLKEMDQRLRLSEDQLKAFKEGQGGVPLSDVASAAVSNLVAKEAEQEKTQRALGSLTREIRRVKEHPEAVAKAGELTVSDPADPNISKLNALILETQIERDNLLLILTPLHPQIKQLDAKLSQLRADYLRDLEAKRRVLEERLRAGEAGVQSARASLQGLPRSALEEARLQREVKVNEDLRSLLRKRDEEAQIKEKEQIQEVTIVRPAVEPTSPKATAQTATKTLVGLVIGLVLGIVLSLTVESLDTSIGAIEDVEAYLQVPVIGLIPDLEQEVERKRGQTPLESGIPEEIRPFLVSILHPASPVAESFRALRTNIEFLRLQRPLKVIAISSASIMEGKTTTAINLALNIAQLGKRVLLVEADLRKPYIHHVFGIPREPGLAEVIIEDLPLSKAIRTATDLMLGKLGFEPISSAPNIDKMDILTSGRPPMNPAELLNSPRVTELLTVLKEQYEYVILDASPILPITDAVILSSRCDSTIIVYRVGRIARSALRRSKTLLENVQGNLLGIVLTGLRAELSRDYEELKYARYTYRYGEGGARRPSSKGDAIVRRAETGLKSLTSFLTGRRKRTRPSA